MCALRHTGKIHQIFFKFGGFQIFDDIFDKEVRRLKELQSFNRKFVPDGPNPQAEERHGYKDE